MVGEGRGRREKMRGGGGVGREVLEEDTGEKTKQWKK